MHWVYVVKSDDGHIYIGETIRLYRRFHEHQSGRGSVNTSRHVPTELLGLYHVPNNVAFVRNHDEMTSGVFNRDITFWNGDDDGDYRGIENHITERYMYENRDRCGLVRGGKYTTQERCIDYHSNMMANAGPLSKLFATRPLCKHGYPCEINMKKDKDKMFFTCPLSRPNYIEGFYSGLSVDAACDFWKEYEPYRKTKLTFEAMRDAFWVRNIPLWENMPCLKCKSEQNEVLWRFGVRHRICNKCFQTHYDSLKKEYVNKPRDMSDVFADCDD